MQCLSPASSCAARSVGSGAGGLAASRTHVASCTSAPGGGAGPRQQQLQQQVPASGPAQTHAAEAHKPSRRALLAAAAAGTLVCVTPPATTALPLAPLGRVKRVGGEKLQSPTVETIKATLERDLSIGQYFVTGDLTREAFADDCRFKDPTNDVTGLSKYLTALALLFDPALSSVKLKRIEVTGPNQIEADTVLQGYLRFPWRPRISPVNVHTVYSLNASTGLVQTQEQQWDISPTTALLQSFTPTAGPPSAR